MVDSKASSQDMCELIRDFVLATQNFNTMEVDTVRCIVSRLNKGRKVYGPVVEGKCFWPREAREEFEDAAVYGAFQICDSSVECPDPWKRKDLEEQLMRVSLEGIKICQELEELCK